MNDRSLLPAAWNVPEVFRNRLGRRVGRQRAMLADGHLLLVLHQPPREDEVERRPRFFWRQPDGSWSSSDLGGGSGALNRHLDACDELLEQYDRRLEKASTARELFEIVELLSPLHRTIRNLQHTLQQARQGLPDVREIIDFRDRAYEIERRADLLHADAQNMWEMVQTTRAEEQAAANRQMALSAHRLNMLVAFFFPVATLAAILGVNLEHGLERLHAPWLFLVFLGLGLLLGILLQRIIGRSSRSEPAPRRAQ